MHQHLLFQPEQNGITRAALVVAQAFLGPGGTRVLDSRAGAVAVAAVALTLRAPFIAVVLLGGAAAAALRLLGWS